MSGKRSDPSDVGRQLRRAAPYLLLLAALWSAVLTFLLSQLRAAPYSTVDMSTVLLFLVVFLISVVCLAGSLCVLLRVPNFLADAVSQHRSGPTPGQSCAASLRMSERAWRGFVLELCRSVAAAAWGGPSPAFRMRGHHLLVSVAEADEVVSVDRRHYPDAFSDDEMIRQVSSAVARAVEAAVSRTALPAPLGQEAMVEVVLTGGVLTVSWPRRRVTAPPFALTTLSGAGGGLEDEIGPLEGARSS